MISVQARTVCCLLLCINAAAQTPAPIFYGSLENPNNTHPALPPFENNFSPIYVAQVSPPVGTPAPVATTAAATSVLTSTVFDPYAAARSSTTAGINNTTSPHSFTNTAENMRRFRDFTSAEFTFQPGGNKPNSFGLGQVDLATQFNFPCRFIPNNTATTTGTGWFYVTPGAQLAWWEGPKTEPGMSANGFGAFLRTGLEPKFNDTLALKAWGQVGIYSDYHKMTSEAFRFSADLEAIIRISNQMKIVAGILYLGREHIKILPTGGLIYTLSDDWELRLVFPNPKITYRLWKGQQADWFGYINADYGGGTWDIKYYRAVDYNDVRLGAGVEFATPQKLKGYFEFGGSFVRELYTNGSRWNRAPSVLYLKTGFVF